MNDLALVEQVPELWTDKSSRLHDYLKIYEREFAQWRDQPMKLLEIGLNRGASIKLWLEYFTLAEIYGVDINEFKNEVGIPDLSRFVFTQGDQSDPQFWKHFDEENPGQFEVIIDDGCHFSGPIIVSFNSLWPKVKAGGYYVIEDLTEVKNMASHTPGFPDQLQFVADFVHQINLKDTDIDEIFYSRDLCILRKKK